MPDRLNEIRARLDAATPGPWRRANHTNCCNSLNSVEDESGRVMAEVWSPRMDYDADLIAHAPADIAWLLGALDAERRANARLRSRIAAIPVMGES